MELENVDAIDRRDRHDEPDDEVELVAVVFVEARDDMELRPVWSSAPMQTRGITEPTRLKRLRKHLLNHLRGVSCQQSLDVSHGLLRNVDMVFHLSEESGLQTGSDSTGNNS